ncbi:MAG TPA: class I SAM-dependent methyltransferase [Chloroflexota bacterium]|nr:class I SAM-dependent methyltransferase [Chloroflexota bacterium]
MTRSSSPPRTEERRFRSATEPALESASAFDRFARFYDLDTENVEDDIPLWTALARRTGGPVLELACGTGRVLLPLARAGLAVVGVDVSAAMLAAARAKVQAASVQSRVELIQADVLELALDRRFPLAIIALDSFGHFVDGDAPRRALERIRQHLLPDGILALDLTNPVPGAFGDTTGLIFHDYTRPGPDPGWSTTKLRSQRQDFISQCITVQCIYDELGPEGQIRRTILPFILRYFHPREIELLLQLTGFEIEGFYGSYELDPLTNESERLVVVARAQPEEAQ